MIEGFIAGDCIDQTDVTLQLLGNSGQHVAAGSEARGCVQGWREHGHARSGD